MRRRDDVPKNPFASGGASSSKSKKKPQQKGRRDNQSNQSNRPKTMTKDQIAAALEKKRKMAEIDSPQPVKKPVSEVKPKPAPIKEEVAQPENNEEERTQELVRRSQETKAAREALVETAQKPSGQSLASGPAPASRGQGTSVFSHRTATITAKTSEKIEDIAPRMKPAKTSTEDAKKDEKPALRPRKRRRDQDKGGGKQPKVRKLDRRKYLEYKYGVRDILDDDRILEEHRSNILGQVWAKGERIGVSDSLEFIDSKVEELIIPEDCAELIKQLVNKFSTKR